MIFHLRTADLRALGIQPWHYRSKFELEFEFEDWDAVLGKYVPIDTAGKVFRFVVLLSQDALPATVPSYDLEQEQGAAVHSSEITFPAPTTDGLVRVAFNETHVILGAGLYWYQAMLADDLSSAREIVIEGDIEIEPAPDPTVAEGPKV